MSFNRTLKQCAFLSLFLLLIFSCKKQKLKEDPVPNPPEEKPAVYQSLFSTPIVSFCGAAITSNLKIQDGTDIGTVTVGNDGVYLYLTYNLNGNWYMGDAHTYAGRESLIPRNLDGNPEHKQFPGKQVFSYCDQRQAFTFRVAMADITKDNSIQCSTNEQYYIAMRLSVKQFSSSSDCSLGVDQPAWGAPFLINPGSSSEWATAFYYCKQDCSIPSFCAYSQGYWFSNPNPNLSWCQNVKFGSLDVNKQQGTSLWPPQNNLVKRAFFQGSALQLSKTCVNGGNPIPNSIINDYNRVNDFLSALTFTNLQTGTYPAGTDTVGVRDATGNIGRWICNNHCTSNPDPNPCTGY